MIGKPQCGQRASDPVGRRVRKTGDPDAAALLAQPAKDDRHEDGADTQQSLRGERITGAVEAPREQRPVPDSPYQARDDRGRDRPAWKEPELQIAAPAELFAE